MSISLRKLALFALPLLFTSASVQAAPILGFPASKRPTTIAVIGDTPYGTDQIIDFPNLVEEINADRQVQSVVHVGDIKTGSSDCSDEYFAGVYDLFATFEDPLIYTPGDNEWTDCHRSRAGKYNPVERLEAIRDVFFAWPGRTLGAHPAWTYSQAFDFRNRTFVENQLWTTAGVVAATVHVVGSNNGWAPWFTDDATDDLVDLPEERIAEVEARTTASIAWINRAFDIAQRTSAKGVVLFWQADVFQGANDHGFDEIMQTVARRSVEFGKPVLLVQGDSHRYLVDQPMLDGNEARGIDFPVPNVTRVVIEGETSHEWLKLKIDPRRGHELFSWERMQLEQAE